MKEPTKSGGDKNSTSHAKTPAPAAAAPARTGEQHRADTNAAGADQRAATVHSENGKPFVDVDHREGVVHDIGAVEDHKPDPKDDPNSAQSVEGSVTGVGSDPSGNAAGPAGKPIDGFGDAAPGNARAATVPLGGGNHTND